MPVRTSAAEMATNMYDYTLPTKPQFCQLIYLRTFKAELRPLKFYHFGSSLDLNRACLFFRPLSMPLFLMSGIPMMGGGCNDRKPIREVLGLQNIDPTNQVLTNEQFGVCVRTVNSQIER